MPIALSCDLNPCSTDLAQCMSDPGKSQIDGAEHYLKAPVPEGGGEITWEGMMLQKLDLQDRSGARPSHASFLSTVSREEVRVSHNPRNSKQPLFQDQKGKIARNVLPQKEQYLHNSSANETHWLTVQTCFACPSTAWVTHLQGEKASHSVDFT